MNKLFGSLLAIVMLVTMTCWIQPVKAEMREYEDNQVKFTIKNTMSETNIGTGKWETKNHSIPTNGSLWVEVNYWRGPDETPFVHLIFDGEYIRRNGNLRQYRLECSNWSGTDVEATNSSHAGMGINPPEKFHAITHCSVTVSDDDWVTSLDYGWGIVEVKASWDEIKDTMNGSGKFLGGTPYNEIFTYTIPFQLIRIIPG
jgi:hypothetical protein